MKKEGETLASDWPIDRPADRPAGFQRLGLDAVQKASV